MIRWFFVVILLAGCSGAESMVPPSVTRSEYCTRRAERVCSIVESCKQGAICEVEDCRLQETDDCESDLSDRESEGASFDETAASACVDDLRTDDCTAVAASSCERVTKGTVALGGNCLGPRDCAPQAEGPVDCAIADDAESGLCVISTVAPDESVAISGTSPEGAACEADEDCATSYCFVSRCVVRNAADALLCGG